MQQYCLMKYMHMPVIINAADIRLSLPIVFFVRATLIKFKLFKTWKTTR